MKPPNDGEQLIIDRFKERIDSNLNNIITFVGQTGMSKSLSSVRIGELLTPEPFITLDPRVVLVEGPKQKRGEVMIFDDVGTTLGARDSSMIINRVIGYFLESFRFLNTTLIVSAPDIAMVDVNLRRLIHLVFEMITIDYEQEKALAHIYKYYTDPVTGISEKIHPVIWGESGPFELVGIGIERPSKKNEANYERIKATSMKNRWSELAERAEKAKL